MQNELTKEQIEKTVQKMVAIARGQTGGSAVYRDMLLSILPNSGHKVDISYWCYKADQDDFSTILLLQAQSRANRDILWVYADLLEPYREELLTLQ